MNIIINKWLGKSLMACLILLTAGFFNQSTGQIVKIELDGANNCAGQLSVDIKVRSSDFSTSNFEIGSSSIFLNFDPALVDFVSYTGVEFNASTSTQASDANWIEQAHGYDQECGLLNIVLQKEDGGTNNYLLDNANLIHVGTAVFNFTGLDADPMLMVNRRFTLFNSSATNDGTALKSVEDYPKLMDYECDLCSSPNITNINPAASSCTGSNGSITLSFPNEPSKPDISFSIDGGITYPYTTPDNVGSFQITGLASGVYDLWARWGDNSCPTNIPDATIGTSNGPVASATGASSCGSLNNGEIVFTFPDHPTRTGIEFSIDGGVTYPHWSADNAGSIAVSSLATGAYDIWVRWGDDSCPTDMGSVDIITVGGPTATPSRRNECDGYPNTGAIILTFDDDPSQTEIKFSIDGGTTYPYTTPDNVGSFTIENLTLGTYSIWATWGDGSCPSNLPNQTIATWAVPQVTSTKTNTCDAGADSGTITFTFDDEPQRSGIEFSIDGGLTFPYWSLDSAGTLVVEDLGSGTYDLWARWGDNSCPVDLANQSIFVLEAPTATVAKRNACGGDADGIITFTFTDNPGRTNVRFSIDGGLTYPWSVNDTTGSLDIGGLTPGYYDTWMRWGDMSCPINLPNVNINIWDVPNITATTRTHTCDGADNGTITLDFDDSSQRTGIEFSIDGGLTFPHWTYDSIGTITITDLPAGTYDLWSRWGDNNCPVDLNDISVGTLALPVASAVAGNTCSTTGSITFNYPDYQYRSYIKFSLDGGLTYPYGAFDSTLTLVANGIAFGTYDLWVRWGDNSCPTDMGDVTVSSLVGTTCDDGDPNTTGDVYDANCNCAGTVACTDLQVSVYLEGAYDDAIGAMNTALYAPHKLLPGMTENQSADGQPYNMAPWNYTGIEGIGWSDADYNPNSVDWILVSLRSGMAKSTEVFQAAGLLLKDGTIELVGPCRLTGLTEPAYYIVLEHRNHLMIMSQTPVAPSGGELVYDFTTTDSYSGGAGAGQKQILPGVYAMFVGDVDQINDVTGSDINASDKTIIEIENGLFNDYLPSDFNMDGDVNGNDKIDWFMNNGIFGTVPK